VLKKKGRRPSPHLQVHREESSISAESDSDHFLQRRKKKGLLHLSPPKCTPLSYTPSRGERQPISTAEKRKGGTLFYSLTGEFLLNYWEATPSLPEEQRKKRKSAYNQPPWKERLAFFKRTSSTVSGPLFSKGGEREATLLYSHRKP